MAGEFISNPIVGAIGNALGLQPLLAAASGASGSPEGASSTPSATPPPPVPAPKAVKAAPQTPREFRQHAPTPKSVASTGRGLSPSDGMQMPGMMSPDVLMHPAVQSLLGQFGISPEQLNQTAQGASPDLFITNPAAHANHPVLAGMAERALEGLAFTQGGRTVGESISNVARGMLDAHAARAEKFNNQLMAPFQQASAVAALQGVNSREKFEEAQTRRAESQADLYDQTPEMREHIAELTNQVRQNAIDARTSQQEAVNSLKLHLVPEYAQLAGDHATAFNDEIKKAGGIGNLSDDRMEYYRQLGHADNLAATTAAKMRVKGSASGAKTDAGTKVNPVAFKIASTEYANAGRALAAFDKETENLTKTPGVEQTSDGSFRLRGSPQWWADRNKKRAALDSAAQNAKIGYESFAKQGQGSSGGITERKVNSSGIHVMKQDGKWVPDPNPPR